RHSRTGFMVLVDFSKFSIMWSVMRKNILIISLVSGLCSAAQETPEVHVNLVAPQQHPENRGNENQRLEGPRIVYYERPYAMAKSFACGLAAGLLMPGIVSIVWIAFYGYGQSCGAQ